MRKVSGLLLPTERRAISGLAGLYATRMLGLFMVLPVLALYADDLAGATPLLVGLALLARLDGEASVVDVLWRMLLCGVGFGLFQPPNNRELMGTVPRERSANASGVMSTSRTVGQSLGVALVGAFLATGMPIQASLWLGALFTLLAVLASLARVPMAGAAQRSAKQAASSE